MSLWFTLRKDRVGDTREKYLNGRQQLRKEKNELGGRNLLGLGIKDNAKVPETFDGDSRIGIKSESYVSAMILKIDNYALKSFLRFMYFAPCCFAEGPTVKLEYFTVT